ncbi:DNA-3-methyladenine glycosylase II [Pediococcus damnosus]|uniref:DNA-3-methyladenine glycosylase n=1 Tax=Pediococcus damnosus TaxID=51663 RepID=UPI00078B575B|nr:DNA-3-methyladenine glycosylase [Pediococcus damnosus]AMV61604.1 DNA-3-methyladenine glycosylase II [Pediococcus damnosus]AMV65966.1 DNA-3-methyladenine glycosylase II [Pediococcus damnosus]
MDTSFKQVQKFLTGRPTSEIAQELLGKKLTFKSADELMSAYIVEDEAYVGVKDQAAHAFQNSRTPKNEPLYHEAGTIYIYQMRTQLLLNLITQGENDPQGVLIRAVQPHDGLTDFRSNRPVQSIYELTSGPGKLMQAFGIPKALKGTLLNQGPLCLDLENPLTPTKIRKSGRVGVPNKGIWTNELLRYFVKGNPYVSKMRKRDADFKQFGWENNK